MEKEKAVIMDGAAITRAINRISYEIIEKNKGSQNIVLVGIKTRGEFLAKRIANKISEIEGTMPPSFAIDISTFRDDVPRDKRLKLVPKEEISVDGLVVIIVDDVLYTGRTVRSAIEFVSEVGRAEKIQLAALIDRGHRELPIRCDYVGKNLPTSQGERVCVRLLECDNEDYVTILHI